MTDEILIRSRLVGDEAEALRILSTAEMRKPRDQARYILLCELEQLGLLPPTDASNTAQAQTRPATLEM